MESGPPLSYGKAMIIFEDDRRSPGGVRVRIAFNPPLPEDDDGWSPSQAQAAAFYYFNQMNAQAGHPPKDLM